MWFRKVIKKMIKVELHHKCGLEAMLLEAAQKWSQTGEFAQCLLEMGEFKAAGNYCWLVSI